MTTGATPISQFARDYRDASQLADLVADRLKGGGGGGTSGGMEERLARLEVRMDHTTEALRELKDGFTSLRGDVGGLQVDVATLKERVAHLPSKGFIVTTVTSVGAVLAFLITFGEQVRKLIAG